MYLPLLPIPPASMMLPPLPALPNKQLEAYCAGDIKTTMDALETHAFAAPDTVAVQYELTDWFPIDMQPTRNGEYELRDDIGGIWRGEFFSSALHNGWAWVESSDLQPTHWRGIRGLLWPGVGAVTIHAA